jgi:hypothetical protein
LVAVVGTVIHLMVKDLQPQVAAAFVVACSTVIVSVASVLMAKYYERQAEVQREHMKRKAEIYERQIEFWFGILFASKMGKSAPGEEEIVRFFHDTMKDLTTWGGDRTLQSFCRFRTSGASIAQEAGAKKG